MPTFKVKNQNGEWENVVSFFGAAGEGGVAAETDPTVPAWAKAANKPSYTASEVGAKASGAVESIATGGTGATTAAEALINLGAFPSVTVVSTTGTNLNDYKESGLWYFGVDYAPTNVPAGSNGWLMVMKGTSTNQTKQIWFRHGTVNTNDFETYVRTQTSTDTWSSWVRIDGKDKLSSSGGTMTGTATFNGSTANSISIVTTSGERRIRFSNDGTGTYAHNCMFLQGSSGDGIGLGAYDSQNSHYIWKYNDKNNILALGSSGTVLTLGGSGMYGTSLPSSGTTGQIFFKY